MSIERPGLTRPVNTTQHSSNTTVTNIPLSNARPDSAHAAPDFSQLHFSPATRQTVVTTTTTTTVHFAPIRLPRTRTIIPAEPSYNRNGPAVFTKFIELDEGRPLALDPKLYPLSQQPWPGGMRNFRLGMGELEGTFVEGGIEEDGLEDDEYAEGSRGDKGKGKETNTSARGAHAIRKKSRRSRIGPLLALDRLDDGSDRMESVVDTSGPSSIGIARLPSPGPPRKRPRAEGLSKSRSSSVESEFETAQDAHGNPIIGSTAGTLPSPNLSPPSPVPTFVAGEDEQDGGEYTIEQDGMDGIQSEGTEQPARNENDEALQYDFGAGHSLSGLLSLPDFVNTFDQLSPALQSYFIFTFLKRSSIPVLQTINNIIAPSLRRDFLTDLPPELGIQILGYLDAKTLCRASIVCKGWRRLVDGEWRVWKSRLVSDGLWIGDGSEAKEAKEISGGSKDNLFLKRWKAGIWDQPAVSSLLSDLSFETDALL